MAPVDDLEHLAVAVPSLLEQLPISLRIGMSVRGIVGIYPAKRKTPTACDRASGLGRPDTAAAEQSVAVHGHRRRNRRTPAGEQLPDPGHAPA